MAQVTQVNPEALNVASQMILREIDLTGTDADRKAKLDQFEKDWKALTGSDSLYGARFVGTIGQGQDVLLCYSDASTFTGICAYGDQSRNTVRVEGSSYSGSLTITPLFSHLEAITIYTDNTEPHKKQNLDNIAAYEANLQALGVDTEKSPMIPVTFAGETMRGQMLKTKDVYSGIRDEDDAIVEVFFIDQETGQFSSNELALSEIVDEKVDKYLNAKSLEAITIKTSNSTDDKAANKAAIEGYVDNLKNLGVDTSKGYLIPVNINPQVSSDSEGLGYMVIKPTKTLYCGQYWYDLDRLVSFSVSVENGTYSRRYVDFGSPTSKLTTTSKQIVGAINEVNGKIGDINTILAQITGDPADAVTTLEATIPVEGFLNETEE